MAKGGGVLLEKTAGVITCADIVKYNGFPSEERFKRGPVPIIECIEEIPCNPCETVCSKNLIRVGKPITNLPRLIDPEGACTGCARCIIVCPGLAIFIVDKTFSRTEASIALPYEELTIPKVGDKIKGVDRAGRAVCDGYVYKVFTGKKLNHTNIVVIIIPREFADEVRYFKRVKEG
ncbi:MAG: 4Fe-4S ferredoxin [Thermodesulfovibrionales bacterium]